MSLILDALRKVERERGAADPAVVVVGTVPWGEAPAGRGRALVASAAVVALVAVAAGAWWLQRAPRAGGAGPAATGATAGSTAGGPATTGVGPAAAGSEPQAALVPARPTPPAWTAPAPPHASSPSTATADRLATPAERPSAGTTAGASTPPAESPAAEVPEPAFPVPAEAGAARAGAAPAEPPAPQLRLTAISQRDGRPVAIVNDRLVHEGDAFDGIRVVRIGEAEVEVEVGGRRHVLRF